jgi:hypothetical protein
MAAKDVSELIAKVREARLKPEAISQPGQSAPVTGLGNKSGEPACFRFCLSGLQKATARSTHCERDDDMGSEDYLGPGGAADAAGTINTGRQGSDRAHRVIADTGTDNLCRL